MNKKYIIYIQKDELFGYVGENGQHVIHPDHAKVFEIFEVMLIVVGMRNEGYHAIPLRTHRSF